MTCKYFPPESVDMAAIPEEQLAQLGLSTGDLALIADKLEDGPFEGMLDGLKSHLQKQPNITLAELAALMVSSMMTGILYGYTIGLKAD